MLATHVNTQCERTLDDDLREMQTHRGGIGGLCDEYSRIFGGISSLQSLRAYLRCFSRKSTPIVFL